MAKKKARQIKKIKIKISELSEGRQNDNIEHVQRASESTSLIDKQTLHKYLEISHSSSQRLLRVKVECLHHYACFLVNKEEIEIIFKKHHSEHLLNIELKKIVYQF